MENIQAAMGSGPWSMEFDKDGKMVSCTWSETFRNMLGYEEKEEFPDKLESWSELLHKEDRERVLNAYWDTILDYTGEKTYNVEYRILTKHAGWRWFHAAGRLSRREDGSPITFVGLFMDIDDEKKMKEQLEKQKIDLQDAHTRLGVELKDVRAQLADSVKENKRLRRGIFNKCSNEPL